MLKALLIFMAGLAPKRLFEAVIRRLINLRAAALPPADALRFLFRLDSHLYSMQGRLAVEHGGGVHTKHGHMKYHDFFTRNTRPGGRVLDLGCGNGAVAYDVAERCGCRVVGIDRNERNIAMAKNRFGHSGVRYILGDLFHLPVRGEFDTVILSNILEHLDNRPSFLRSVRETTGAARFLIRVPVFERDWRVPLKKELGVEWRLDADHRIEYTNEGFMEELAEAGLNAEHIETRWGEIWAVAEPGR